VRTPPLRERREDIPLLADHFRERFNREMGKRVVKLSEAAMELLLRHAWPGNVRELENAIERAVALESTEAVLPERLPDNLRGGSGGMAAAAAQALGAGFDLDQHLREVERDFLARALEQGGGDRGVAAELLGVSPRSLRYLIQKHGLGGP